MTQKKRPTAAQVLEAIREAATRCRQQKEEKRIADQKRFAREYKKAKAPAKLYTSIVNPVNLPCDHRVCMCNVNSYCGHIECPTGKIITP